MHVLLRYRSLGDVVLAAAFTRALAPVVFVTHERYVSLVSRFPGVVEVRTPGQPIPKDARVIDLQHNLRSLRIAAHARVSGDTWARVSRVAFKTRPGRSVLARYAEACGVAPAPLPWLETACRGDTLLLAPGAAHANKRWEGFTALARAWGGPVRVLGGPEDEERVREVAQACGGEALAEQGFAATLAAMKGGAVLVAGDTGLLHLGAAVGLPVVGLFGPTTSADGFFAYADGVRQRAVEIPLDCRPCSRHGGADCPIGDHLCMRALDVSKVLAAAQEAARA